MNRIDATFEALKKQGKKALITFVTAGDPSASATKELVKAMAGQGADIIELGIPYSDPIAEGPVIQAANVRAMAAGTRIPTVFNLVRELRTEGVQTPLLFLLYYNCILQYGAGRFLKECVECGVDGLIVPDLPLEERDELKPLTDKADVHLISMVSPLSGDRIEKIVKGARGFLYCVSSLGVTGVRSNFETDFSAFFSELNRCSSLPKAIGFGISSPEQVRELKRYADGLIVGSAIVKLVGEAKDAAEAVVKVGELTRALKAAL